MASPEVGGRQWWHEQLLVLPVVRLRGLDLAATHGGELTGLRLYDLATGDVLNCLRRKREREREKNQSVGIICGYTIYKLHKKHMISLTEGIPSDSESWALNYVVAENLFTYWCIENANV